MFKFELDNNVIANICKAVLAFLDGRIAKGLLAIMISTMVLALTACSSKDKEEQLTDPKILYREATEALNRDEYPIAATKFEQLEREHPASELAAQAQINRAYAQYLDGKFDDAVMITDEFIKQYPAHHSTPYMYYLKGLCYYDRILDVGRDQELANKTIRTFGDLVNRFPNSKYARDAQLKIDYAYNMLAGKDMDIGRFYLDKGQLIAAVNRFKTVVDKYQRTIFVAEALYRMAEIYYTLGDLEQAKNYAAVLGYNYPDSPWYDEAYNLFEERGVISVPWYKKLTTNIW
jgi:outer membrane protein assembly factor BamD